MPTYEFRCPDGHTFDQFHRISDAPSTAACPTCGAVAERAISGGAGLVFKGSGFYLTDYGKNAHRTSGPANKTGDAGGAKGEAKSEGGSSAGGSTGGSAAGSGGASGGTGSSGGSSSSSSSSSGSSGSSGTSSSGSSNKSSE